MSSPASASTAKNIDDAPRKFILGANAAPARGQPMRDEMDYPSAHAGLAVPVPPSLAATAILDEDVRAWFLERAGLAGEAGLGALVNSVLR